MMKAPRVNRQTIANDSVVMDGGKSFEDAAFDLLSTVSPIKLPRDEIPFDSIRQIVLNEVYVEKKQCSKSLEAAKRKKFVMDELDDMASTSSSSHPPMDDHRGGGDGGERGTMTDETMIVENGMPRSVSARLKGERSSSCSTSSIQHVSSAPALFTMSDNDNDNKKKQPLSYKERRQAEVRQARLKKYRENVEVFEFSCDEVGLKQHFTLFYESLMTEENGNGPNVYYRIVDSLDNYFRGRTWENNVMNLAREFLVDSCLKTCETMNNYHEEKMTGDELRAKEVEVQVLLSLHVFLLGHDDKILEQARKKLQLLHVLGSAEKLKEFLNQAVCDIFIDQIGESLAKLYDEMCIELPTDLSQFDNGFKMTDNADDTYFMKRRNTHASKLEQMFADNTMTEMDNGGSGGKRKTKRIKVEDGVTTKKRDNDDDLASPPRRRDRNCTRKDYKQFFVEETPDEKRNGRNGTLTEEELNEVVLATPVAKLRMQANNKNGSGRRVSKRLSELVTLSDKRTAMVRKAEENVEKLLEKAKASTPLRSVKRVSKSVLFANFTPGGTKKARVSLKEKFDGVVVKQEVEEEVEEVVVTTPTTPTRRVSGRVKKEVFKLSNVKQELDDDYEQQGPSISIPIPTTAPKSANNPTSPSQWSDRRLRSQLGLTRDDLNRYRQAMVNAGVKKEVVEKPKEMKWDTVQMNRAHRMKGAGASEDGTKLFGGKKKPTSSKTMICHVLLNDTNPDATFDWNKVKFDAIDDKPRTRRVQSLLTKPEEYMESLKRKYVESKSSPSSSTAKRRKTMGGGTPQKKTSISRTASTSSIPSSSTKSISPRRNLRSSGDIPTANLDDFGFEIEDD